MSGSKLSPPARDETPYRILVDLDVDKPQGSTDPAFDGYGKEIMAPEGHEVGLPSRTMLEVTLKLKNLGKVTFPGGALERMTLDGSNWQTTIATDAAIAEIPPGQIVALEHLTMAAADAGVAFINLRIRAKDGRTVEHLSEEDGTAQDTLSFGIAFVDKESVILISLLREILAAQTHRTPGEGR